MCWVGWADWSESSAELHKSHPAEKHAGCHRALLAFYGRALGVPAVVAVDEALTATRRHREPSGSDVGAHSSLMEKPTFSVPAKKMAMWLFIIADTATFAGCLVAYGFIRNATPNWPRPFHSITNVAHHDVHSGDQQLDHAVRRRAAQRGDKAGAFRWTMITAAAGILFATLHIREWMGMINEGATLFHNPWGTPLFGSLFFSITGLHLLHVTGGVSP